ncbi:MAG: hypothetical protein LZF60_310178 [Nitrospira sp.]|nr:MAG: hypothetical protein LZF60_310178 [Nitrospira sp.]
MKSGCGCAIRRGGLKLVDKIRSDQRPTRHSTRGIEGPLFVSTRLFEKNGKVGQQWSVEFFPPELRKSFGLREALIGFRL